MTAAEALVEIEKGVRAFKAFQYMEKAATFVQNLEQVEKEAQSAADKARAELESLNKQIADAKVALDAAKEEGKKAAAAAKKRAEETIAKAEAKAAEVNAAAEAARKVSEDVLGNLLAQRENAKAEIAEAEKTLAKLLADIDTAKARIANLLGA